MDIERVISMEKLGILLTLMMLPIVSSSDCPANNEVSFINYLLGEMKYKSISIRKKTERFPEFGNNAEWPDLIKKCNEDCYRATKALLASTNCNESADDVIGNGVSGIYDFAILTSGMVNISLSGNISHFYDYYTAPHFLSSCGLVISYRVIIESEPYGFDPPIMKQREKLVAMLFTYKSGKLALVAEEPILDHYREYAITHDM